MSEAIVTFDGAPERGSINFSVGQPSADLLPLALLQRAGERFFARAQPLELNYGQRQGDARFRAALAAFLAGESRTPVDPDSLMLTAGISQALDFVCARFSRPGDVVFVEEPSYPYSFQIFRDHGLAIVGVPVDGAGMDIAALERLLARHRPRFVYTIPAFHNPTGQVMDRARRDRLLALSREHGFVIVADEVYQLLHHGTPPPASFGARHAEGRVVSLGSFSKILAPGLRLGWIQAAPEEMRPILASGALVSGGNFNHFTSHLVRQLMEGGELSAFVAELRERYAERAQAMDTALSRHLAGAARWMKPGGGYFFWLELREGKDAAALEAAARAAGTGFLPGSACSTSGGLPHCLRLSFAHYTVPEIHEGIARLRRALIR
jgi:2-aminoadipate transaminase